MLVFEMRPERTIPMDDPNRSRMQIFQTFSRPQHLHKGWSLTLLIGTDFSIPTVAYLLQDVICST